LGGGSVESAFPNIEEFWPAAIATLLDPRYKDLGFYDKLKAKAAKRKLIDLVYEEITKPKAAMDTSLSSEPDVLKNKDQNESTNPKVRDSASGTLQFLPLILDLGLKLKLGR